MSNLPKNRQFDAAGVPKGPARDRLDVIEPSKNQGSNGADEVKKIILQQITRINEKLRRSRQVSAHGGEDVRKYRHHFDQEKYSDANGHYRDDGRIHHGRFHFLAQAGSVFEVRGQPGKNFRQQTAFLTSAHHGKVQLGENFGMLLQGFRETIPSFHSHGDVLDHIAHHLVIRLFRQGLQGLHHGQTGIHHRRQLSCKNHQVAQRDFAAGGAAFLGRFFLDGDDHQVAVQQSRNGIDLGRSVHSAANLAARGRIPGDVTKRWHN